MASGVIDPTKVGRYPVVLSDALLGRDSDKAFTAVRYNHKPPASSSKGRLKPANSGDSSYDLSFRDDDGQYAYEGTRSVSDKRYVLIFDPDREVFVLHKVDSTFNMNVTRTPSNTDPESLRRKHPHLEGTTPSAKPKPKSAPKKADKPQSQKKSASAAGSLPLPQKPAPAPKRRQDDSEDSSDDDFLTIENPGGEASAAPRDFSPAFNNPNRGFEEFLQHRNDEEEEEEEEEGEEIGQDMSHLENGDDADGEDDDDDDRSVELFQLPSPMRGMNGQSGASNNHNSNNSQQQSQSQTQHMDVDESEEDEEGFEEVPASGVDVGATAEPMDQDNDLGGDDIDDDLEAEMMAALEEQGEDQESDVSEEE